MLALRLARGSRPAVRLRRLLVATASAGTGLLLLCTLGHALGHHAPSDHALLRLAWCVAPLAATVYFAVAVARTDPATRPRPGLSAIGLGPAGLMTLSAVSTALACGLGSLLALVCFLQLRGGLGGLPLSGAAGSLLTANRPLPVAAVVTLLALVPLAASAATAFVLRPRTTVRTAERQARATGQDPAGVAEPAPPVPTGLPWGVALLAIGLAVETYAARTQSSAQDLPLPGGLASSSLGVLSGWTLTAIGLATAGPALTHHCGRLLQAVRPGALRLLAGRILQGEAQRIGRPLGVVCAVASGAYAGVTLYSGRPPGTEPLDTAPLSTLGALLVAGCALATLLTAAVEARQSRAGTTDTLLRLGAPPALLRNAAALRAGALLALFGPVTWLVASLAALPLTV